MGSRQVLVVDDDQAIREALAELLEEHGFTALTAANGRMALDMLDRVDDLSALPGAIVLDLMMPLMDGWTFRKEQLKRPALRDIPVVVMSAAASRSTLDAGVSAFIAKPFKSDDLLRCVEPLC